jgi:glycosyltransferase involved in cell wall biosynthesis
MRILIDAVGATTGGGASRSRELARTLPALAPDNDYLFVLQPHLQVDIARIAPRIATLVPPKPCSRMPLRVGWEHLLLPRKTMGFSPEVVLSPFNVAPVRWPKPKPRLAVIVSNLAPYSPVVRELYGGRDWLRLESLRRLTDRTIAHADHVFLLSRQAYALIDASLLAGKSELIPMAPPPLASWVDQAHLPAEPYFVIVGDLMRYKGVEIVLEAMSHFPPANVPLLLVCGAHTERSYLEALRDRASSLGLRDRIRMLGPTDHSRVLAMIAGARACILPSRFENLTRVPIEAMSLGTPVVARNIESYRESCEGAAMYFDSEHPQQLARHMHALLRDDALRAEWAQRAKGHAISRRPEEATTRILQVLEGG